MAQTTNFREAMPDLFEFGENALQVRMGDEANQYFSRALWYVWGREDQANDTGHVSDTKTLRRLYATGYGEGTFIDVDFAFAEYVALRREAFDRQLRVSMGNIGDLWREFVAGSKLLAALLGVSLGYPF